MDIMELGANGELVGGLAVIGSLIYVGLQVRQNTTHSPLVREPLDQLRGGVLLVPRFEPYPPSNRRDSHEHHGTRGDRGAQRRTRRRSPRW